MTKRHLLTCLRGRLLDWLWVVAWLAVMPCAWLRPLRCSRSLLVGPPKMPTPCGSPCGDWHTVPGLDVGEHRLALPATLRSLHHNDSTVS